MAHDIQLFTNNAVSLLATPIGPWSTSLTVMAGLGALYPNPGPGEYFLVTLEDQTGTNREIIRVNSRSGDTFSGLLRAQEGTTARSWDASLGSDTLVDHRVTAETMRQAMTHPAPISLYDQPFTLLPGNRLQLSQSFIPGTVRLYLGGLRQKLGADYTELAGNQLQLNQDVSQSDIDTGLNIIIDFDHT